MALAFLLNPSRRPRRRGRCLKKARTGRCRKRAAPRRWSRREAGRKGYATRLARHPRARVHRKGRESISVGLSPSEVGRGASYTLNPRRRRNGGKSMAKKKHKSAARRKAAEKGWRTWRRRHPKRKTARVGRRAKRYGRNNPRRGRRRRSRRNPLAVRGGMYSPNPRRRRRRRNPLAVRGGMYSPNPRRRSRRRRNAYFLNPRRRKGRRRNAYFLNPRRGRRRNPASFSGALASIKRDLTNPATLMQFAAGAAGATVSEFIGTLVASKIRQYANSAFLSVGFGANLLDFATRIAGGILASMVVPARYKGAFTLGAGAMAAKPFVDMLLGPALSATGALTPIMGPPQSAGGAAGIGSWISVGQSRRLGVSGMHPGLGAYISVGQGRRLGVSGLGDGDAFSYGSPVASMYRYDAQPIAAATAY